MDVFDNCRICLREINHEPIKMTKLILGFLQACLQLTNVTKPSPEGNVKQNLCAPCFNRISEFQDFLEQCKDSDEFWKTQFEDVKEIPLEKQIKFEQTALLTLAEENNALDADTTVTTTEVEIPSYAQEDSIHSPELELEQNLQLNQEREKSMSPSQQISDEENETIHIEEYNSIGLTNWPDETSRDNERDQTPAHGECDTYLNVSEEIIEYEYQIKDDDDVEVEENLTLYESASSDTCGVDYRSLAYEKIETESSNESAITHEATKETVEENSETSKNSFFMTTTMDKNGKVKMSYKCQICDKTFSRIYDIESHYNIHSGAKPFTCNVCGKSFRQKNILTTHQALHFGKKVECAECGKKFARRSQLILHYRMHRDEKPFVCNFDGCQAAFRQRKQLIDHSFIHTGEKNFQCATCTKSFHTRKRLQDHIYKVHSQHRYRCELCEKAFLKPHMLKHHMMSTHNIEMDDVSHLKTLVDGLKRTKKSSKQPVIN